MDRREQSSPRATANASFNHMANIVVIWNGAAGWRGGHRERHRWERSQRSAFIVYLMKALSRLPLESNGKPHVKRVKILAYY